MKGTGTGTPSFKQESTTNRGGAPGKWTQLGFGTLQLFGAFRTWGWRGVPFPSMDQQTITSQLRQLFPHSLARIWTVYRRRRIRLQFLKELCSKMLNAAKKICRKVTLHTQINTNSGKNFVFCWCVSTAERMTLSPISWFCIKFLITK